MGGRCTSENEGGEAGLIRGTGKERLEGNCPFDLGFKSDEGSERAIREGYIARRGGGGILASLLRSVGRRGGGGIPVLVTVWILISVVAGIIISVVALMIVLVIA